VNFFLDINFERLFKKKYAQQSTQFFSGRRKLKLSHSLLHILSGGRTVIKKLFVVLAAMFLMVITACTSGNSPSPLSTVNVTVSNASFILSNEGVGLINELVANGYGDYDLYDTLLAMQQSSDPTISEVVTDQFLTKLLSCPADSAIFTTKLRDYLDSTPQSVTAVSKAAVMRAGVSINMDMNMGIDIGGISWTSGTAYTFILSNEGGGLISQLVASGYGDYSLYSTLLTMQNNTDPSIAGIVTPSFLAALQACPNTSDIKTHKLSEYTGSGVAAVAISTDGTVQVVSVFGRTYYGTTGTATMSSAISSVGNGLFTYTTTSSPLTSFSVSTTTYNVFGVGWAPSTTAAIAISTDCTVQVVNIYGSSYYGQTGTATLNSNITDVGSADFTYTTSSLSPLMRWIVTGKTYDAFAIGWVPASVPTAGTLNGGVWLDIVAH
jgi:hypothetical protein